MGLQLLQSATFPAAAQYAVMPDAYKAMWQYVLRKPSGKFLVGQRHLPGNTSCFIIFVTKRYFASVTFWMRWLLMATLCVYLPRYSITLGPAKRTLGIYYPVVTVNKTFDERLYRLYLLPVTVAHTLPGILCLTLLPQTSIYCCVFAFASCHVYLCRRRAQCNEGGDAGSRFCPQVCSTAIMPNCTPALLPNCAHRLPYRFK